MRHSINRSGAGILTQQGVRGTPHEQVVFIRLKQAISNKFVQLTEFGDSNLEEHENVLALGPLYLVNIHQIKICHSLNKSQCLLRLNSL